MGRKPLEQSSPLARAAPSARRITCGPSVAATSSLLTPMSLLLAPNLAPLEAFVNYLVVSLRRGTSTGLGCRSREAFRCPVPAASLVHQFRNLPTKPVAELP
jgi:hypothetical protein